MNFDRLRKAVGERVQLRPPAMVLDEAGNAAGGPDDAWRIEEVAVDSLSVKLDRTGHCTKLGKDHVHHYTSNPDETARTGIPHGFLVLNVQIYLCGARVQITPTARPGEPVFPQLPPVRLLPQPTTAHHSPIPEITEVPYTRAREQLIAAGWQPRRHHWSHGSRPEMQYGNGAHYWLKGFWEIGESSPTGFAFCRFHFRDVYGNHLVVVTAGEAGENEGGDAVVWNWFFELPPS